MLANVWRRRQEAAGHVRRQREPAERRVRRQQTSGQRDVLQRRPLSAVELWKMGKGEQRVIKTDDSKLFSHNPHYNISPSISHKHNQRLFKFQGIWKVRRTNIVA